MGNGALDGQLQIVKRVYRMSTGAPPYTNPWVPGRIRGKLEIKVPQKVQLNRFTEWSSVQNFYAKEMVTYRGLPAPVSEGTGLSRRSPTNLSCLFYCHLSQLNALLPLQGQPLCDSPTIFQRNNQESLITNM